MDKFPETSQYLFPEAAIIHSPAFESAFCKLQAQQTLSIEEEKLISFKGDNNNLNNTQENKINSESFVERMLN